MTRATHNFLRGIGSIVDLVPIRRSFRVGKGIDLHRTDAEALRRDWARLTQDFWSAFDETVKETGEHVQPERAK